ncbi:J domain-containing protein [Haloarcula sp. S1CR25-12]|uniref:J domain-containing protein n=1 Tax=Haloarcula saliterrae TaxID=2950534 RepID=A0ABU2FAK0_9EURY|nr:J domain-containing protein [Haloarcula sp. S1CR25-12]MDS0258865.1 J domain-containing protein [Haloarcula sp. S1CR25-12]
MQTLYGVLGVEPTADEQRIVSAYRERVKTHHPDVTDAPDARTQFRRLTTAREVLTDETERRRYDRLGHERYVRRHLDGGEWTATAGGGTANGSRAPDGETVSEAAQRMADRTARTTTEPRTTQRADGSDGYGTAAEYYRPGQRVGVESRSGFGRTLDALSDVLPWLLAHFLLLGAAVTVATVLLTGTSTGGLPPVTSIFVAATMVGVTAGVSILHLTSTVYR